MPSTLTKKKPAKKKYTVTNTDRYCIQNPQSPLSLAFYRLQLYNGLYMLDVPEQVFLYSLALVALLLVVWYSRVFLQGFVDGWRSAETL
jgi:hypothetical protein